MSDAIPLTGADCFLRAFESDVRRRNRASHVSQLVLRLGPGFDVEALRAALARAAPAAPILRAPIRRPWGLGPPVYRVDLAGRRPLPRIAVFDAAGPPGPQLPEVFFRRLNDRFDGRRGELLRFDVVRYAGGALGSDLAMSWLHMLFDGAGSEHFLRWLDACHGAGEPSELPEDDAPGAPPGTGGQPLPASAGERGRMAVTWQERLRAFAAHPPHSLAGPARRVRQDLRYRLTAFTPEATRAVLARAREKAGFLTPMLFYLAAAIRAHHAVFRARGADPGSYVVPVTVNARPRGREEAIFRTRVSLVWFQVLPERVDDLDALIDALREQRRAAIRQRLIEGGVAAMEFARWAPAWLYAYMTRRTLRGELASFFFAFTDAFLPGFPRFLGAPIENGFHAPAVTASPGSAAISSLRDGRLNLSHVYQRGVLDEHELRLFGEQMTRDLTGSG